MRYILIIGNPIDGWKYYGPFETEPDALDHPATDVDGWTWWVAELRNPTELRAEVDAIP